MTKQSLSLSTVLGTGVFCAALVAAPITASLISGSAYALDASMTKTAPAKCWLNSAQRSRLLIALVSTKIP